MSYDVLQGREGDFEAAFHGLAKVLAGAPGHIASRLYRDVERPRSYLIYSEWSDRQAFARFVRSEAFREATRWGREQILAGPPTHRILSSEE